MSIEFVEGNLLQSDAEALVNPINCVGTMGGGLALQFKQRFPDNFWEYKRACNKKKVTPGKMWVYETFYELIINFPTKDHYSDPSKIEYIKEGLEDLVRVVDEYEIRSIAIPQLGCGLGGLRWEDVRPLIVDAFKNKNTRVLIYGPEK